MIKNRGIRQILEKLNLKPNSKILDIGCFGQEGDNGSDVIAECFYGKGSIKGICTRNCIPKKYSNIKLIQGDYFKTNLNEKFDLIFLDLGGRNQLPIIENDLRDKLYNILNKDGYLVYFIFPNDNYANDHYQEELMRKEIINHMQNYWLNLYNQNMPEEYIRGICEARLSDLYDIISVDNELTRDYITWIVLKKIKTKN